MSDARFSHPIHISLHLSLTTQHSKSYFFISTPKTKLAHQEHQREGDKSAKYIYMQQLVQKMRFGLEWFPQANKIKLKIKKTSPPQNYHKAVNSQASNPIDPTQQRKSQCHNWCHFISLVCGIFFLSMYNYFMLFNALLLGLDIQFR